MVERFSIEIGVVSEVISFEDACLLREELEKVMLSVKGVFFVKTALQVIEE